MTETLTAPISRELATIEAITEITSIPDATEIVRARIRGWDVVVRKADFSVGDQVVYIEVDSFLRMTDSRFVFLEPRGVRTDEQGNVGHVLKTARLRGQYSQGLALPLSEFPELSESITGDDVTEALRITKWDPPLPDEIAGSVSGRYPSTIPGTGEQRVQNFAAVLDAGDDGNWVATEKVDGTSMTVWVEDNDDERTYASGVAGRNYEFEYNPAQAFWATALDLDLHEQLRREYGAGRAVVQGELYGAGVLGKNPLDVREKRFAAFTVYVDGSEITRGDWPQFILDIAVPLHDLPYPKTVDEALAQVDGLKSLINPARNAEGVVWRNTVNATVMVGDRPVRASWKCISNKYAMKHDS
jgi:RNA ligase (TIGR02306 family)